MVLTDQKSVKSKKSRKVGNGLGYFANSNVKDYYGGMTNYKSKNNTFNEYNKNKKDGDGSKQFATDINTLQTDIQNRINFAIMKIDQMNLT